MDAKEGMAGQGEHRISVVDNAGRSDERVGAGIHEEVTSPAIKQSAYERWIKGVQEKIERASTDSSLYWSLVPDDKRKFKIAKLGPGGICYEPRAVTVGPYHRRQITCITEKDKWLIVDFMNRLYGLDLAGCLRKVKNLAEEAASCYSNTFEPFGLEDGVTFEDLLLLDSYFILFVFMSREIHSRLMRTEHSPIASMRDSLYRLTPIIIEGISRTGYVVLDLLIHSNQIPFFVIEELFKEIGSEKPLHKYALEFFDKIHPRSNKDRHKGLNRPPEFLHLLDLFHWSRVPENKFDVVGRSSRHKLDYFDWARYSPTATELRESATKFEKKTSGSSLDITFRRGRLIPIIGVLDIPKLHIHDYSSFIFHNLIALEMQCPSRGRCAMAFAAFMRNLLQREGDAKLLRQCGILANTAVTDGELVDFFKQSSRLADNYQMPGDLHALYDQVASHHCRRTSRFWGNVILHYFPLVTFSVLVAAVIFVLTFLQTIYTIVGFYYSRMRQ